MAGAKPVLVALICVVVAGCAATTMPSPDPAFPSPGIPAAASSTPASTASLTPSPTLAATAAPTPAPTLPAGRLPRTAVVEQDGVRVKIELERNPIPAGEWTRLTTVVRNTGDNVVTWFHDGCAITVGTWGEMASAWRPGIAQTDVPATFKDRALDLAYRSTPLPGPIIDFVPERWAGTGTHGCADLGMSDLILPGKAIRQRYVWEGHAGHRWGPPPSGPVTLTGTFAHYWRGREEPEGDIRDRTIEVALDAWITGGADDSWLSPPEVVDAALADPAFVAYLETQDLGNGREEILWYRPELGAWEVGVLVWYEFPEPRLHLVLVDPHTGAIRDTVDRPWNEDVDGFP
ncbi:MAG: hypothetical protein A2V85_05010 [Chloroflexi bacterium RBG_16_72_14]|nr:MAG: hypothetical protein A2V85_05010 [Chloroflexi bacterium RBG_16_72_14]